MNFEENIDVVNHPGPGCPDFCAMGVDGACVSLLEEPPAEATETPGWFVYRRRRQEADGTLSVELVIHQDGGSTHRQVFPLDESVQERRGQG